ncbi:hypothetical protein RCO48_09880 [Peribacillus frigoritolerans]|nr:hypothetical protein [Peribacillus frigoritolerans]
MKSRKSQIIEYAGLHDIEPRFDPSNETGVYARNRFRHEVLPFLKKENRKVHEHFQRFSEELYEDEEFFFEPGFKQNVRGLDPAG